MSGITINFCPQCGNKLQERAKFCSECGLQLGDIARGAATAAPVKRAMTSKQYAVIGLLALAIWVPVWMFQDWKAAGMSFKQTLSIVFIKKPVYT